MVEEALDELMVALETEMRLFALLYYHVAREEVESLGKDGEVALRQALRRLNRWRGEELRKAHEARGLPINMATLMRNMDSPSIYLKKEGVRREARYTPRVVHSLTSYCPMGEVWMEKGFERWGHVYCDETHQSIAYGYHPDAVVVIPENLLKGDPYCRFQWVLPSVEDGPEVSYASKSGASPSAEAAAAARDRFPGLLGSLYYFLADSLLQGSGERGEEVMRRASRAFGRERGEALRRKHEAEGKAINLESLISGYDLPIGSAWKTHVEHLAPPAYRARVESCPLRDAWRERGGGRPGTIYCREVLPALFTAYHPGITAEIDVAGPDGTADCRYNLSLSS